MQEFAFGANCIRPYPLVMPTTFTLLESSTALTRVAIIGALDLVGTQEIELKFTASTAGRHKPVIIDISQVHFVASAGLGLLIRIARTLSTDKHSTVLFAPNEIIQHAIHVSKLGSMLRIATTLAEALEMAKLPAESIVRSR